MRVLLVETDPTWAPPLADNEFFSLQLVRQAATAEHELRRLVLNNTEGGKTLEARRIRLRPQIDRQVVQFDPQIIHVCALGIVGHLVLESGAPYVLSTWGHEFVQCQRNARLFDLAQQVLENAGCVLVDGESTGRLIETTFGPGERPLVCLTDYGWPDASRTFAGTDTIAPSLDWLWPIYQEVIDRRAGPPRV